MLKVITNLGEGPKKLNAGNCVKEPSFILCVSQRFEIFSRTQEIIQKLGGHQLLESHSFQKGGDVVARKR
jgi:hypothetical protein